MDELISVIVPVYKVEEYLDRCVQSIVSQSYTNLEIILVDDGSPDNCPAICDAWAEKDSRIRVIHKENGGLSDARNAGMAAAAGTLMGFVDGDDWISPEMYRTLYENMNRHDSDIAACGMELVWDDGTPSRMLTKPGNFVLNTEEAILANMRETWIKHPVVCRLYKTALIRGIPFLTGKCHEDAFWTYQALGRAKRISIVDTPCYFYYQRRGSIMGVDYSTARLDALDAKAAQYAYIQLHFPRLLPLAKVYVLFCCVYHMQMCLAHLTGEAHSQARARIRRTAGMIRPVPIPMGLSAKQYLWLILARLSLEGTCRLRNFLKIGM